MSSETKYYCKDCGKELSKDERPCSSCGSNARHIKVDIQEIVKLYDYFPSGSTELNSFKKRVNGLEKSGIYEDSPLLTKKEFDEAITKMEKDANKKFWCGISIGVFGIIVTIITAILLC